MSQTAVDFGLLRIRELQRPFILLHQRQQDFANLILTVVRQGIGFLDGTFEEWDDEKRLTHLDGTRQT
jgi:hypothetical protein